MGISDTIRRAFGGTSAPAGTPVRAVWRGAVLAESDETVVVDGNHYFPRRAVNGDLLQSSKNTSVCPWKGTARYYDIVADGGRNAAAAWCYPSPKPAAAEIKDHVAFWKGVRVEPIT